MGNPKVTSGVITLKDQGGGVWGSVPGQGSWADNVGLLWPDGVEPVESSIYPLADGKRVWYVDLDEAVDGNGDEATPVNNFTDLVGWWDGVNYHEGTLGFTGGDQIWVTGEGTASKHSNGVSNMNIDIRRDGQMGTASAPTVIRSWKGRDRVKFDGEYTENIGVYADGQSEVGNGLVLINLETTRSLLVPISLDDFIEFGRVISCYSYYNYALSGGPASTYGGIVVRCSNGLRDIEVSNCLTHNNNTSDGSTIQESNNIGGINLLNQATANPLSNVSFYLNEVYEENYAIRHKQSGVGGFKSYNNILHDSNVGHYIRNAGVNDINYNIIYDCDIEMKLEAENQPQKRTVNYFNNTVSRVSEMIETGNQAEVFQNFLNIDRNIYYNISNVAPLIVLGQFASDNYDITDTTSSNNIFFNGDNSQFWENNGTPARTLADWQSTIPDTTSITDDPLFTDAANNDYTLQAGSPAIDLNGFRVGAL